MGRKRLSDEEYRENLMERHSESIVTDFRNVFDGEITLSSIAKKYGISKMRTSQIFERLYGKKLRKAKTDGSAEDNLGNIIAFKNSNKKKINVVVPEELYIKAKAYAASLGISTSTLTRDCLSDFFEGDGLLKLNRFF